jgi:CelD/BcsL family acetyltransferase involved in cellulose biosynthesis
MNVAMVSIDDSQWDEFARSHPAATPFHLPAWATLVADCYRFKAFALTARDADGQIMAGVPAVAVRSPLGRTRLVSLPFTDCCPVLTRPGIGIDDVTAALGDYVRASDARELEIRSGLTAASGVYPRQVGYTHTLALPKDPADLRLHRNFRQHRNQAVNRGIAVTRANRPEDVQEFYRLHTLTRRRLGVPVQPKRFFDLLSARFLEVGTVFVATATQNGETVAACLYMSHNGTLVAKYSASDPARRDDGASHLIHWEMMSAACIEGYHTYDLGRTDLDAEGLRVFKTRMGTTESPLFYTHVGGETPSEKRPHVGTMSRRVISKSPVWVCRALGEALYRWTA